jgi:diguanylate cyclase (GGDEF)-like protein
MGERSSVRPERRGDSTPPPTHQDPSEIANIPIRLAGGIWEKFWDHIAEVVAVSLIALLTSTYFLLGEKVRAAELWLGGREVTALSAVIGAFAACTSGALLTGILFTIRSRRIENGLRSQLLRMERDSALEQTNEQKVRAAVEGAIVTASDNGEAVALVLLDVDDFRRLNNEYSYDAGSFVLRQFARLLSENVRGSRDRVMRYFERGDEFLVLLPGTSLENAYQGVAERLRKLVKGTRFLLGDREARGKFAELTVSAGLTAYSPGDQWKDVRDRLVGALHEAKRNGKDRCVPISVE